MRPGELMPQPRLLALPPGPDKLITRQSIETELGRRLDVGPQRAAQILNGIGASISESVTPGQIDDVRGQLPDELRSILPSQSAGLPEAHPGLQRDSQEPGHHGAIAAGGTGKLAR